MNKQEIGEQRNFDHDASAIERASRILIRPLMLRCSAAKVRRTRSKEGTLELLFSGGEKIVWDGAAWHYIAASH
jgi:hypothetical protein